MAQKFPGNVVQLTPAQIQRIQNTGIPLYIDGSKGGHTFIPSENGRTVICTNTPALTFPLGLGDGFQVPIMGAFTLSGSGQPGMAIVNGTPSTDATAAVTLRQTAPGVYAIASGGASGPASAISQPQANALIAPGGVGKASGVQSFKAPGGMSPDGFGTGGRTIQTTISCVRGAFYGVRLVFPNSDTTQTRDIKAIAGASATFVNTGTTIAWTPVTFGAMGTAGVIPIATTVSGQTVPGLLVSDFIPVGMIARTDSGATNPLFVYRTYSSLVQTVSNFTPASAWNAATGVEMAFSNVSGDLVAASTTAMAASAASAKVSPAVEVQFYTGGKVAKCDCSGDSLTAGAGTDPAAWSGYMTQALQAAGYPMTVANWGTGGQYRDNTSAILQRRIALTKPDIVIIFNMSVNSLSGSFPLTATQQTGYTLSDLDAIKALGAKPIVVTMHGQNAFDTAAKAYMAGWGAVVSMRDSGLCDANGTILAQYTTDGTHLNTAGAAIFGPYIAPFVAALIG